MNHLLYILQIADNALINGHRLSEWCGHGPVLEQDIALSNIALDHLGQARSLYQHATELFKNIKKDEQLNLFQSVAFQKNVQDGHNIDEDDFAFLRDSWDFRNCLLVEQPNKDWAYTIARSFLFDNFNYHYFSALVHSKDENLAAIAEKSLKEITYHLRWSSEWIIRLGDGTEISHQKMQQALNDVWMYSGELFKETEIEKLMFQENIGVDLSSIKTLWQNKTAAILEEATLEMPKNNWAQDGGKEGRHSEHLGYLLAEMQFMQRAYPNMEW